MPKRTSKKPPTDINVLASSIVRAATGGKSPTAISTEGKHLAAVILGRLGGLKGGKARAKKLTPKKRSEIARKAAHARWGETQS